MKTNKILVLFNFETGEPHCPYWQVLAVVNEDDFDKEELEDCFMSYLDSSASDDKEFEDMVKDILSSLDWKWELIGAIPACDLMCTIWI